MSIHRSFIASILAGLVVVACSKKDEEPGGARLTAAAITPKAEEIFTTRCASCHGTTGRGDGPAAAALNPKPRNYTDARWQASVRDDDLRKIILQGGAAVGKSPLMPPNVDLEGDPETLDGLVAKVRSFAR